MVENRKANPLAGKRVVITRAREQAGGFARLLEAEGAIPVLFPTIAFRPLKPPEGWRYDPDRYHWLVFTSANGVRFFLELLPEGSRLLGKGTKVAVIGPGTREKALECGIRVDVVPEEFIAESVVEALGDVAGKRILIPRAKVAREVLPEELRRRGAEVEVLAVYETFPPQVDEEGLRRLEDSHIITFTSPSTVENFVKMLGEKAFSLCSDRVVASIGPVTTDRAKRLGIKVDVTSKEHSIPGLIDAIKRFLSSSKSIS